MLFLSAALFSTGVYGVLARRNAVLVLMSIELMLNAVNINLVAFGQALHDITGQVFALFVITVAAAEVGIGLAIVILIYRNRETINVDEVEPPQVVAAESAESIVKAIQDPSWFLRYSWLIALLPAVAAAFTLFIGKRTPGKGSVYGITALAGALVMSLGVLWTFVGGERGFYEASIPWFQIGQLHMEGSTSTGSPR